MKTRLLETGSAVRASLLVAGLAPGRREALKTLGIAALIALAAPALRRRGRTLRVRVADAGGVFDFHVDHLADLHVLREVWCARIYDAPVTPDPRLVVDVGANIGATVAFFKSRWPDAIVHAFEPDPRAFAKLDRNVGHIEGVELHRAAVGGQDGEVTLWSSAAAWKSSVVGPVGPGPQPVTVPQRTLASALSLTGDAPVDLLKFDAEGAEFAVLPQVAREPRVRGLMGELHFDLAPTALLADVLRDLSDFELDLRGDSRRRMEIFARRPDRQERLDRPVS